MNRDIVKARLLHEQGGPDADIRARSIVCSAASDLIRSLPPAPDAHWETLSRLVTEAPTAPSAFLWADDYFSMLSFTWRVWESKSEKSANLLIREQFKFLISKTRTAAGDCENEGDAPLAARFGALAARLEMLLQMESYSR